MYSRMKAELDAEKASQTVNLDGLAKAKSELDLMLKDLQFAGSIAANEGWISGVSGCVRKAVEDYKQLKAELTVKLEELKKKQNDELRLGIVDLMQKSNALDLAFNQIQLSLEALISKLDSLVVLKSQNANKESAVLDKLNNILP